MLYQWTIITPKGSLNVRQSASTSATVLGTVKDGDTALTINSTLKINGWNEIISPVKGWVYIYGGYAWVQVVKVEPVLGPDGKPIYADGFDSPVGTPAERATTKVYPGEWYDATGFARFYTATGAGAYHTGADLNLAKNADANVLIYAAGDGIVTTCRYFNVWGNIIVIEHYPTPELKRYYTRYAHMDTVLVREGQVVKRGDSIARVGSANGRYSHHLHFDVSHTTILKTKPNHWPGVNLKELQINYLDPVAFLLSNKRYTL